MLQWAHSILMILYVVLPPMALMALLLGRRPRRPGRPSPMQRATVAIAMSLLLGIAASIIYGLWLGGIVEPGQVVLTCYFVAGLLCLLKLLDFLFDWITRLCFAVGYGSALRSDRRIWAQTARVVLLFALGLPYMIAAAATYRPKVIPSDDPIWWALGARRVEFKSTDGLMLSGLWIAAGTPPAHVTAARQWGRKTVIICPGSRGGSASYVNLAREFVEGGYNVLSFDFRAHGRSEGQLITFGDGERWDVLGAVHWLRGSDPAASGRIVGIGIDTGAAALISAAAEPGGDGQSISALALFGCYDRFDKMAATMVDLRFMEPLRGLVLDVGLPLACLQTGVDLGNFSPAAAADAVAPRPILFVHGKDSTVILFERGESLYDAASAPKSHLWLDGTDEDAVNNPDVAAAAREFLDKAVPML